MASNDAHILLVMGTLPNPLPTTSPSSEETGVRHCVRPCVRSCGSLWSLPPSSLPPSLPHSLSFSLRRVLRALQLSAPALPPVFRVSRRPPAPSDADLVRATLRPALTCFFSYAGRPYRKDVGGVHRRMGQL
jgi:hypothetical protein